VQFFFRSAFFLNLGDIVGIDRRKRHFRDAFGRACWWLFHDISMVGDN